MSELHRIPFVLLESPFAGKTPEELARNREYALEAMRHSLYLGEAPFASHLLYTQMLDDDTPAERMMGRLRRGLRLAYVQTTRQYMKTSALAAVCNTESKPLRLQNAKLFIGNCAHKIKNPRYLAAPGDRAAIRHSV